MGSLRKGRAAVFSGEVDDAPVLVDVAKVELPPRGPDDSQIQQRMRGRESWRYQRSSVCAEDCGLIDESVPGINRICELGKRATADAICQQALTRLAVSRLENPDALSAIDADLYLCVEKLMPSSSGTTIRSVMYNCFLVQASEWLADHWGTERQWSRKIYCPLRGCHKVLLRSLPPVDSKKRGSCCYLLESRPEIASQELSALQNFVRRYATTMTYVYTAFQWQSCWAVRVFVTVSANGQPSRLQETMYLSWRRSPIAQPGG